MMNLTELREWFANEIQSDRRQNDVDGAVSLHPTSDEIVLSMSASGMLRRSRNFSWEEVVHDRTLLIQQWHSWMTEYLRELSPYQLLVQACDAQRMKAEPSNHALAQLTNERGKADTIPQPLAERKAESAPELGYNSAGPRQLHRRRLSDAEFRQLMDLKTPSRPADSCAGYINDTKPHCDICGSTSCFKPGNELSPWSANIDLLICDRATCSQAACEIEIAGAELRRLTRLSRLEDNPPPQSVEIKMRGTYGLTITADPSIHRDMIALDFGAPVDPLDVEYDGWTLRELLAHNEKKRREEWSLAHPYTPAQRAAISAHWSAELRAKSAAAKQKEREQVVVDRQDEP